MCKIVQLSVLVFFFAFFLGAETRGQRITGTVPSPTVDTYVPGEILVKYKPSSRILSAEYYQRHMGITTLKAFERIGVHHIKLPKGMKVDDAVNTFQSDPDVEYAEPNYFYRYEAIPDDPGFGSLWALHNTGQDVNGTVGIADSDMDIPEAWDITTGSAGVIVAVIDSGVDYNHPDLAGNIWTNPGEIQGNNIDDDGNGYIDDALGWDFFDNDNNPTDPFGHGTHLAGIIGAVGNNGIGISGINWNVKIMVLKTGDENGLALSSILSAIAYATRFRVSIINCSWGNNVPSQALKDAIDNAPSAFFVCAAGHDDADNDVTPIYPSSLDSHHIIAVTATDQFDNLMTGANYGVISVDVGAPGENILSCFPGNEYRFWGGTSMAAACVSGLAALLKAQYPFLNNVRLKIIIKANVDSIGALDGLVATGGRVNGFNALSSNPTPVVAGGGGGGGCFIASAAFGSRMAKEVKILKNFRDNVLLKNALGAVIVKFYYKISPPAADFIANHYNLRMLIRWGLLPLVGISWIALTIGFVPTAFLILVLLSFVVSKYVLRNRKAYFARH